MLLLACFLLSNSTATFLGAHRPPFGLFLIADFVCKKRLRLKNEAGNVSVQNAPGAAQQCCAATTTA